MTITIEDFAKKVTTVPNIPISDDGNVGNWLNNLVNQIEGTKTLTWLLAHVYDGVVWGKQNTQGNWLFSNEYDENLPPLNIEELLELRLFGAEGELFIWRVGNKLYSRLILDDDIPEVDCIEEQQILWGTKGELLEGNQFTRLNDGQQGLVHAVPLPLKSTENDGHRLVQLQVKHYIAQDEDTGLARVVASRLTELKEVTSK